MKKPLVSLMMIAALSLGALSFMGSASAQDAAPEGRGGRGHHGPHGGRGRHGGPFSPEAIEHRLTRLTERLSLDAHQVTLVREILTSARAEAETLRAGERGPERRAAFRALMESTATRIDAVLNETQRAQFAELRAHMHERREARREGRRGRGEGRPGARGDRGI
jgi:periplasmic protein CpxP/Spy